MTSILKIIKYLYNLFIVKIFFNNLYIFLLLFFSLIKSEIKLLKIISIIILITIKFIFI
jgi:hypothetical protein